MFSFQVSLFSAFLTSLQIDSLMACRLAPWTISFCLLFHRNWGASILPPAALVGCAGWAGVGCLLAWCLHPSELLEAPLL